jgi:hypothetical protein
MECELGGFLQVMKRSIDEEGYVVGEHGRKVSIILGRGFRAFHRRMGVG